jgi:hypothetical protein
MAVGPRRYPPPPCAWIGTIFSRAITMLKNDSSQLPTSTVEKL